MGVEREGGLGLQDPVHPGCPLPPRACPKPARAGPSLQPPGLGCGLCPTRTAWPCGAVGREADTGLPSRQDTATSTCFPRMGPHCHQPPSLSTSASSAPDSTAEPPWVLQVPVCIPQRRPSPPLEWRGDGGPAPPASHLACPPGSVLNWVLRAASAPPEEQAVDLFPGP